MNICFVLGGFCGTGGIGRVVSILSREFSVQANISQHFIVMDTWDRGKFLYKLPSNIHGCGWDAPKSMRKIILHGGVKKLRQYVVRNNIDIVIGCGALYYPLVVLSCIGLNTKTICWEHSNANNSNDHRFQMQGRWFGAKFSDAVVVLTKMDKKIYEEKYHPKKLVQIYNPIDPELLKYKNVAKYNKRIISVGRFTYQKNYPLLVDIAADVLSKHQDWEWHLYGEGMEMEAIQKLIKEKNISDKLLIKGRDERLYEHYKNYSILVNTSRYEGFSMTFLEAMANCIPIVSFDIECGPKEVIVNEKNGYLVPPFDKDTMVQKINSLIENEDLLDRMSSSQKEMIKMFGCDGIVEKWNRLFSNI